jgi:hypothetical protein
MGWLQGTERMRKCSTLGQKDKKAKVENERKMVVTQFGIWSFGQGASTGQGEDTLFKIEADAEVIEESILSQQSYSKIFQGGSESNGDVVFGHILNGDLKIEEVRILKAATPSAAEGIVPSRWNVQT